MLALNHAPTFGSFQPRSSIHFGRALAGMFMLVGEPLLVPWQADQLRSKDDWREILTNHLRNAQRQLAAASIARDTSQFEVLFAATLAVEPLTTWLADPGPNYAAANKYRWNTAACGSKHSSPG